MSPPCPHGETVGPPRISCWEPSVTEMIFIVPFFSVTISLFAERKSMPQGLFNPSATFVTLNR